MYSVVLFQTFKTKFINKFEIILFKKKPHIQFLADNKTNTNLKKMKWLNVRAKLKFYRVFFPRSLNIWKFNVTSAQYRVCPPLESITAWKGMDETVEVAVMKRSRKCCHPWSTWPWKDYPIDEIWYYKGRGYRCLCFSCF